MRYTAVNYGCVHCATSTVTVGSCYSFEVVVLNSSHVCRRQQVLAERCQKFTQAHVNIGTPLQLATSVHCCSPQTLRRLRTYHCAD
eukprot:14880-Heterococcus_DN1.PRE.2